MFQSSPPVSRVLPGVRSDGRTPGGIIIEGSIGINGAVITNTDKLAIRDDNLDTTITIDSSGGIHAQYLNADKGESRNINVTAAPGQSASQSLLTVYDENIHRIFNVTTDGKMTNQLGSSEFDHIVPASAPAITGSRATMGVGVYQLIQALAAEGRVIDSTTA